MSTQNLQDLPWMERLANISLSPLACRQVFLMMTRSHYLSAEHFGSQKERMKDFVWSKDKAASKMLITYDYDFKEDQQDELPAIYVGTSDYGYSRLVSDNYKGTSIDNASSESVKRAATTVIIRHVARTPEDTLLLGDMTGQFYRGIQPFLMETWRKSGAVSMEVQRLLTSRPFQRRSEQADQRFMCDLVIGLVFDDLWLHFTESHPIKTFSFQTALDTLK